MVRVKAHEMGSNGKTWDVGVENSTSVGSFLHDLGLAIEITELWFP